MSSRIYHCSVTLRLRSVDWSDLRAGDVCYYADRRAGAAATRSPGETGGPFTVAEEEQAGWVVLARRGSDVPLTLSVANLMPLVLDDPAMDEIYRRRADSYWGHGLGPHS